MQRAIVVALGVAIASSATGLGLSAASRPDLPAVPQCTGSADTEICRMRVAANARAEMRALVEQRYEAERERCAALPGPQRDGCFIAAHAARGRALLEAAAPYERRS